MGYIFFINIILCILLMKFARTKKQQRIMDFFVITNFILFMGGSGYNLDYEVYSLMYQGRWPLNKLEFLFSEAIYLARALKLTYDQFYFLLCMMGCMILFYAVRKLLGVNRWFYLFYLIWPFFLDAVQIRNFICMSFLVLGLSYLICDEKYAAAKFLACLVIGAGFQTIAIMYLPIPFLRKVNMDKLGKIIIGIGVIAGLIMGLYIENFMWLMGKMIPGELFKDIRFENYTQIKVQHLGYLFNWGIQVFNFIFAWILKKMYCKRADQTEERETGMKVLKLNYEIWLFMFLYMPLYRFNGNFHRIMRNLMPYMYISLFTWLKIFPKKEKKINLLPAVIGIGFFLYLVIIVLVQLIIPHGKTVIPSMFKDRIF